MTYQDALERAFHGQLGLVDFQERATRMVAGILFAIASLVNIATMADGVLPVPLVGGLLITAGLMCAALARGPRAAASVLLAGGVATLTLSLSVYPAGGLAVYFCLVVIALAGLGHRLHGVVAAVVSSGSLLMVAWRAPELLSGASLLQSLVLIWVGLALALLATWQLRSLAGWAEETYRWACLMTAEARQGQAELARLSKSLDVTCHALERHMQELAAARAAAEAARRRKAEFAAAVGHELRTPVNLIIGFSELLLEASQAPSGRVPLPESYYQDLLVIHRNARHISQLVDDILDLSQVDANRMALQREPLALATVAREAADAVRQLCTGKGLSLIVSFPPDLPCVLADPLRIRQVLINLLYNSIRYTDHGGVTVTAKQDGATIIVAVSDTGPGIPADHLPRLFEEFRQVEPGGRGRGGSGLGLAICKRFIELHGGSIWAVSAPGMGSTFYFRLPVQATDASDRQSAWAPPAAPAAVRRRLLVLDQAEESAAVLRRYLDGYEVLAAQSPDQADALATEARPHALLVASAAGRRIAAQVLAARPDLRGLPVVTCPLRTRATLGHLLGVADYLVKPVRRDQLAQALRRLRRPVHRLVLVEDDQEMSSLLTRMLASLSPRLQVSAAADGEAGLRLIGAQRPDAVLLDLLMPEVNGYTVIERLRADAELRHIPIIVLSAKGVRDEIVANTLVFGRQGGLSVAEVVASLRAGLDALTRPGGDMAGVRPADSAG